VDPGGVGVDLQDAEAEADGLGDVQLLDVVELESPAKRRELRAV